MKKLKLIDIAPYSGKRVQPFDGVRKYLSTGDLQKDGLNFEEVTFQSKPSRADILVSEGDILFAKMVNTNKVLQIDKMLDGIIVSTGFSVHRPNKNLLHGNYLIQFLKNNSFLRQKNKLCTGAIQSAISNTGIGKIFISVPPISDQIQIANILIKAEVLIEQRRKSIALLDEFLKSTFVEMFGDPVKNEKGFQIKQLGEILYIKHGFAFSSEFFTNVGEYVLLTPGNFYEVGGYRDREEKQKYYKGEFPKEYLMKKGELLVAMTEQAAGLLGSAIIIPESNKFLHNQRLGLVQFSNKVLSTQFLFHLFNFHSIRFLIHAKATGIKVRHTSPTRIQEISIGVPPIVLQTEFASIVNDTETLKEKYKKSLAELENLYGSICQEAFKA